MSYALSNSEKVIFIDNAAIKKYYFSALCDLSY